MRTQLEQLERELKKLRYKKDRLEFRKKELEGKENLSQRELYEFYELENMIDKIMATKELNLVNKIKDLKLTG